MVNEINLVKKRNKFVTNFYKHKWLYLMLIPGLLYFLVFRYAPMWGIMLAFKNYSPYLGFANSPWVGLEFFKDFFNF